MRVIDFGIKDYKQILDLQQHLFDKLISYKLKGEKTSIDNEEIMLTGEHFPVITMGRRTQDDNLLVSNKWLSNLNIGLYRIGRGGDVTYHCPGQLIVYPIIDLEKRKLRVKDYVDLLEESVIRLLEDYGIKGERVEGATGVWIGKGSRYERKICAIGIKCSHFCTMHGLAINVDADLSGFSMINPCGFKDKGVTSIEKEIKNDGVLLSNLSIESVKEKLLKILLQLI